MYSIQSSFSTVMFFTNRLESLMEVVMVVVVINLTEQLLYNLSNHFREEIQIGNGTKTFHFLMVK